MTKEEWQFGQAIAATIRRGGKNSTFREKIARSTCVWRVDVLTAGTGNYVRALGTQNGILDVNRQSSEEPSNCRIESYIQNKPWTLALYPCLFPVF